MSQPPPNPDESSSPSPPQSPQHPKLRDYGALEDLQKYYPSKAMRAGVETIIDMRLTLDASGAVTNAEPIDPKPSDFEWGFPDAAVTVAKTLKFENASGETEHTRLRVKFALKN